MNAKINGPKLVCQELNLTGGCWHAYHPLGTSILMLRIGGQKADILTVVIANFETKVTTVPLSALSYLS